MYQFHFPREMYLNRRVRHVKSSPRHEARLIDDDIRRRQPPTAVQYKSQATYDVIRCTVKDGFLEANSDDRRSGSAAITDKCLIL